MYKLTETLTLVRSETIDMSLERRRTTRHCYRWAIEVTEIKSGSLLEAVTRDIGVFGCFVETPTPFLRGTVVTLKITRNTDTFAVAGDVAYAIANEGIGIAFGVLAPSEYALLKEWLAGKPQSEPRQQPCELAKA